MAPAHYESKWRPIKTNCGALIFSHKAHSSTHRKALTKWISRIAINGDDKRLSINEPLVIHFPHKGCTESIHKSLQTKPSVQTLDRRKQPVKTTVRDGLLSDQC